MSKREFTVTWVLIVVSLLVMIFFIRYTEKNIRSAYVEAAEPAVVHVGDVTPISIVDKLATNISIPRDTLAYRLNNPFNLRYRGQYGATEDASNFARFGTLREGIQAGLNQIKLDAGRGHTLRSFIYKYAPPEENDSEVYLSYLVQETGMSWKAYLCDVPVETLARAIMSMECGANWQQK